MILGGWRRSNETDSRAARLSCPFLCRAIASTGDRYVRPLHPTGATHREFALTRPFHAACLALLCQRDDELHEMIRMFRQNQSGERAQHGCVNGHMRRISARALASKLLVQPLCMLLLEPASPPTTHLGARALPNSTTRCASGSGQGALWHAMSLDGPVRTRHRGGGRGAYASDESKFWSRAADAKSCH